MTAVSHQHADTNPHTPGMVVMALGTIATVLASAHSVQASPEYLHLVVGADSAAIGLFILNAGRWLTHLERGPKR